VEFDKEFPGKHQWGEKPISRGGGGGLYLLKTMTGGRRERESDNFLYCMQEGLYPRGSTVKEKTGQKGQVRERGISVKTSRSWGGQRNGGAIEGGEE